jgi:hypothetical protein
MKTGASISLVLAIAAVVAMAVARYM